MLSKHTSKQNEESLYAELVASYKTEKIDEFELLDYGIEADDYDFEYDNSFFVRLLQDEVLELSDLCSWFYSKHDMMHLLVRDYSLFQELSKRNLLNKSSLNSVLYYAKQSQSLYEVFHNRPLHYEIIKHCGAFQDILNTYKTQYELLRDETLVQKLLDDSLMTVSDIEFLLNTVHKYEDVCALCANQALLEQVLSNFLLTFDQLDEFTERFNNSFLYKDSKIDLFAYTEKLHNEIRKKLPPHWEFYRYAYKTNPYSKNERIELIELLKNSESSRNKFREIIENHLEDDYNFESLMQYLKKSEKKNFFNI